VYRVKSVIIGRVGL